MKTKVLTWMLSASLFLLFLFTANSGEKGVRKDSDFYPFDRTGTAHTSGAFSASGDTTTGSGMETVVLGGGTYTIAVNETRTIIYGSSSAAGTASCSTTAEETAQQAFIVGTWSVDICEVSRGRRVHSETRNSEITEQQDRATITILGISPYSAVKRKNTHESRADFWNVFNNCLLHNGTCNDYLVSDVIL